MKLEIWNIYLRNGIVYVPTVARTTVGYFMDIEPVEVVPVADTDALQRAIIEIMNKGNPVVPAPPRTNFPKPVLLKCAKVKSWSAFEKEALVWTIEKKDGNYQINPGRRRLDKGWEDDPEKTVTLPLGTTIEVVVERAIALMLNAAAP